jgi:hypothetical protein
MTFGDWLSNTWETMRSQGFHRGGKEAAYQLYLGGARRYCRIRGDDSGDSVFDREWDLLVILDACRVDLLEEVVDEYAFLSSPETFRSRGGNSQEWMAENFTPASADELARTVYVSGNVFTQSHADPNRFAFLDEVWKYAWDDDRGTVPARPITERAVSVGREYDPDRLLVHYMQPHAPSVPDPLGKGMTTDPDEPWESAPELLRRGEIDRERVWQSYLENLRYVLDDVAVLLKNVDAETAVITADHGELLGEYGLYDHPKGLTFDTLREVPWVETTARDEGTLESTLEPGDDSGDRAEKLRALGYL